eukprot:582996-Pelagomonas_calceolata.AAC.2
MQEIVSSVVAGVLKTMGIQAEHWIHHTVPGRGHLHVHTEQVQGVWRLVESVIVGDLHVHAEQVQGVRWLVHSVIVGDGAGIRDCACRMQDMLATCQKYVPCGRCLPAYRLPCNHAIPGDLKKVNGRDTVRTNPFSIRSTDGRNDDMESSYIYKSDKYAHFSMVWHGTDGRNDDMESLYTYEERQESSFKLKHG